MSDLEEIFEGESPIESTEPTENTEPEATPEIEAQPLETSESEPESDEVTQAEPEPQQVPVGVVAELRQEKRALQDDLANLKRQLDAMQNPQPQEPEPMPDVYADPDAYTARMQSNVAMQARNAELNTSEMLARDKHGDSLVDDALAAAQAAGVLQQFIDKRHPYGDLVKWHESQRAVQEIGDPATFKERLRAEITKEIQAELAAKQVSEMAEQVTPSLARTKGTGGNSSPSWTGPTDLNSIFD